MKPSQNLIIIFFIFICSTAFYQPITAVLTVSQYKPDSFFQKPYFVQDDFTNISTIFSGGFASQAYTNTGIKVPYMQQFGSESLLKKFTDPSLPSNNTESWGQGLLTATFHVREIIISCYKNMAQGFFIEGATALQDLCMNSISIDFDESSTSLTENQIKYIQSLQQQIPQSINQSGMFTTAIYAGYSTTFSNFKHLDFIDLTIKMGFTSPQAMTDSNSNLVQFPFNENLNFGYPLITAASFGFLDWVTFGCNGAVIPWQSTTKSIPMNSTSSDNILLLSESGVATIKRGPLVTTALYFEADHFHNGLSGTIGYYYTKNYAYTIIPQNQIQFTPTINSESPLFKTWSFGSLYLQLDIDFACEARPNAAIITIFCNIPIIGKSCPKTSIFGGSCNLQISYIF